jgi:predicted amidohydrolase YtcJ
MSLSKRVARRDLLMWMSAGLLQPRLRAQSSDKSGQLRPDLVVWNARVITMDPRQPAAEAFAIRDGHFVAVGSNAEIRPLAGASAQTIDAKGGTIVPGFIDTHNHLGGTTLLYEVLVGNPFEVEFVTIDSVIGKLRDRAARTPAGDWVEGYFLDDTKVKDSRKITVQDLDRVSTTHPIAVHHRGGHTSFYNSRAFEMAGVGKQTPNPPGGMFERDAGGQLTGRVSDKAKAVFYNVGRRKTFDAASVGLDGPHNTEQAEIEGLAHMSKMFARYGITTVHHEGGGLSNVQRVRAAGKLLHRVSYELTARELDEAIALGLESGFGDEWVRIGATTEHMVDGSFSERTMAMSQPYPGTNYKGNVTTTQEDLNAWVERVHRSGIQVNCHANGDVAIGMYLTALERAQRLWPRADARPKITHCTLIDDSLVRRMRALGAVPSLFTTYAYYNSDKFVYYGEDLMKRCMAFRSLLDAGVNAAAGSDFFPGPFDPRMAIQGMVTRTGWDGKTWGANQRISLDDAIRVNTLNGAWNSGEELRKGSITAGKLADFVQFGSDLRSTPTDRIKDIPIVRTVVSGRTVYQA